MFLQRKPEWVGSAGQGALTGGPPPGAVPAEEGGAGVGAARRRSPVFSSLPSVPSAEATRLTERATPWRRRVRVRKRSQWGPKEPVQGGPGLEDWLSSPRQQCLLEINTGLCIPSKRTQPAWEESEEASRESAIAGTPTTWRVGPCDPKDPCSAACWLLVAAAPAPVVAPVDRSGLGDEAEPGLGKGQFPVWKAECAGWKRRFNFKSVKLEEIWWYLSCTAGFNKCRFQVCASAGSRSGSLFPQPEG
ncbi:uncharacterized protein LOC116584797 isoform X2 [Mustela erminea]|uniref:uncharacterized protein LOC116584797 isoform X2 n=1 Tax=Mustela erminea TaxID=36723 RepID=UPI0013869CB8|nr:uncharacterized protein LOC116584797 isoform X2 [Mustela erminea]